MTFEYYVKDKERIAYSDGKAEGAANEKREIAKNMKAEKIDVETISRITGLSIKEIFQLG